MRDKIIEILERPMWEPYPQWREITPSDIPAIADEIMEMIKVSERNKFKIRRAAVGSIPTDERGFIDWGWWLP